MGDKPDLESSVRSWLESTGYKLEFQTHEAFRRWGLESMMGFFVKSSEGKQREIDVTACDKRNGRCFRVMCECKYSADKPWVLLYSGTPAELFDDWRSLPMSDNFPNLPREVFDRFRELLLDSWHFGGEEELAHSIVQAHIQRDGNQGNRDIAYDSLQKIVNAACDHAAHGIEEGGTICPAMIVLPCLIVESPLLSARLDSETGEFDVQRISFGRLAWLGARQRTVVDVVQAAALDDYAAMLKATIKVVNRFLDELFLPKGTLS